MIVVTLTDRHIDGPVHVGDHIEAGRVLGGIPTPGPSVPGMFRYVHKATGSRRGGLLIVVIGKEIPIAIEGDAARVAQAAGVDGEVVSIQIETHRRTHSGVGNGTILRTDIPGP